MAISYNEAVEIVRKVAREMSASFTETEELLPLVEAVGRISKHDCLSPLATPTFDSSAMDGYAVNSDATIKASEEAPLILRVRGTIAAGDAPISLSADPEDDVVPCVEIMTGARFPESVSERPFDACVPVEETRAVSGPVKGSCYIQITKPVRTFQHRRFAGSDYQRGDLIFPARSDIQAQHVMAMASLGLQNIAVLKRVRIGIWSTGSELLSSRHQYPSPSAIPDANGPYIVTAMRSLGIDCSFLGILNDNPELCTAALRRCLISERYDVLITTGAVSAGKFDFVRRSIENLTARVHFHKVAIRPGHPVLFAAMPAQSVCNGSEALANGTSKSAGLRRDTAFFGLPGNPIASAACLRFLVIPYLRELKSQPPEGPTTACIIAPNCGKCGDGEVVSSISRVVLRNPLHLDAFRHGSLRTGVHGWEVMISGDQSPGKTKPFASANCWVHVPHGHGDVLEGDSLQCYPLHPQSL